MKFFLPLATSTEQAERVYLRITDRLKRSGFELKSDRIHKVIFREGEKLRSETVGATSDNGEIVLAIFQNDIGYFICIYIRERFGENRQSLGTYWSNRLKILTRNKLVNACPSNTANQAK